MFVYISTEYTLCINNNICFNDSISIFADGLAPASDDTKKTEIATEIV